MVNLVTITPTTVSKLKKLLVSKVVGMKLTKIGSVDFIHTSACDILGSDRFFLCFDTVDDKVQRCGVALAPLGPFKKTEKLHYMHISSKIAASNCKLEKIQL